MNCCASCNKEARIKEEGLDQMSVKPLHTDAELCRIINDYWRKRGYTINARVEKRNCHVRHADVNMIVSDNVFKVYREKRQ